MGWIERVAATYDIVVTCVVSQIGRTNFWHLLDTTRVRIDAEASAGHTLNLFRNGVPIVVPVSYRHVEADGTETTMWYLTYVANDAAHIVVGAYSLREDANVPGMFVSENGVSSCCAVFCVSELILILLQV